MKLQLADLKTERQWRAATGFDQARFEKLLVLFTGGYVSLYGQSVAARQTELEVTPSLPSEADLLLFTLFSLKSGLTYDLLGLVCGMDAANAKRNQELGLRVLEHTLAAVNCLPKRGFRNAAEFADHLHNEAILLIDGTEQRTQRPTDDGDQKEHYSGKKKCHTAKAVIVSNPQRRILYVSQCWVGKTHDYRLLREEFPPEQPWFKDFQVRVDLGFLGIERDYVCKELLLPNKKKKKQELSQEQKDENQARARTRIYVEHAIGGMKRYRILSDRLRVHDVELYNVILGVCAGLWNYYLTP
jgi:hypothetical protein